MKKADKPGEDSKTEKTEKKAEKKREPSNPPGENKAPKKAKVSEKAAAESSRSRPTKKAKKTVPIDPPVLTLKEQRKEILDFLVLSKDFTEENAKEELRKMIPDHRAAGCDCSLNIYWQQKGVKGIGVGAKSASEGKDVGLWGYKTMCISWIFAIAAAIKAGDIYVTFMHLSVNSGCFSGQKN